MNSSLPLPLEENQPSYYTRDNPWLKRFVKIEPHESRPLFWASAYFFFILLSYYLIHPLRNAYGATKEAQSHLKWLFTISMLLMLGLNPIYGSLISRFSRRRFIPWAYYFFVSSLVFFFFALVFFDKNASSVLSQAFYVWASVFNLFIVSIFWDLLVDIFNGNQGKRFFSLISVIGNFGALLASIFVEFSTHWLKPVYLILASATMLLVATLCGKQLHKISIETPIQEHLLETAESPPGRGSFSFLRTVFSSQYLLAVCAYTVILIISGTFIYIRQLQLVSGQHMTPSSSTSYFARTDFLTNVLVILLQTFLAGRVLAKLGITKTLILMPCLIVLGLGLVYLLPSTGTFLFTYSPQLFFIMILQILSRALEFSIVKPARKVLFTVLNRDEKYSAQSFIDTFIHRGADVTVIWTSTLLTQSGVDVIYVGLSLMPVWLGWVYLSIFLGKRYRQKAQAVLKAD